MPEMTRTANRGWLQIFNNDYSSEDLLKVDGEEVRVAYDIHDATRVIIRRMDGSFVCEAIWNGNKRAAIPVPMVEVAKEKRKQRRLARVDEQRREIEAEGRPLLEAPAMPDFNFGQILQGELQQAEQSDYHFLQTDREHAKKTGTWNNG